MLIKDSLIVVIDVIADNIKCASTLYIRNADRNTSESLLGETAEVCIAYLPQIFIYITLRNSDA